MMRWDEMLKALRFLKTKFKTHFQYLNLILNTLGSWGSGGVGNKASSKYLQGLNPIPLVKKLTKEAMKRLLNHFDRFKDTLNEFLWRIHFDLSGEVRVHSSLSW